MPKPRVGGRQYGANVDRTPSDNVAWCNVEGSKITLIAQPNHKETGDDLVLGTGIMGMRGGSLMNLTRMTEAELLAIKQLIDQAFELALPVVRQRDEEANAAFNQGDDTFERVYRAVPKLVFREGAVAAYMQSVHERPDDLLGTERDGDSSTN